MYRCSTWLYQVPDLAQNMHLCQPTDKFTQSQIMVLILLTSIKAVNILLFNSSLQTNNLFLYKPIYTSTKALERKGYLTPTYICHLTTELHNCIKFSHMKLLYGFLSRGRKYWDSSTANHYMRARRELNSPGQTLFSIHTSPFCTVSG